MVRAAVLPLDMKSLTGRILAKLLCIATWLPS